MILPASIFAYDTETDRLDPEDPESTYCALVQICPIDAQSVDDVTLFESDHAVDDFLAAFERTPYDCEMHCYNLGNYEFEWIRGALIRRGYRNIQMDRRRKLPPITWRTIYDKAGVFRVDVINGEGYVLRIKDDMKLFDPSQSMESVAKSVRKEHPEWFDCVDVVKETVAYNSGWHFYPDRKESRREEFLYYSKLDAFSQSRITKYLVEKGLNDKLSSTSTTLRDALEIIYPDIPEEWKRMRKFAKQYPPLDEEMQDYAESRLIGGFVWGEVGTFHGTFSKFDYKSSYPYEYVFGKLPRGKIGRFPYSDPKAKLILQHKGLLKWLRVSFDFKLKEGMMPCINAKEAGICHFVNRKMIEGHVEDWLYNENLFNEIGMHYDLSNVEIIEVWFAKSETGRFAPAIRHFFDRKETSEKGSAMYSYAKKGMNGGIHGKTITKTHRQSRVFREDGEDNEDALWVDSVSKPKLCFMIGFTALENARCRLLHDCRMMIEHGFHIYMCDTDSMIVDATPEQAKEILGEKLIYPESSKGKEMEDILGKFELECEFDKFKCWGLKRYLQLRDGEFVGSAFAGMHDEVQREELKNWKTDGTIYEWQQKVKVRLKREHGVTIEIGTKKAGAMDVWFRDDLMAIDRSAKRLMENDERFGTQYNLDMWKDQYNQLMLDTTADEDMIAYLHDIRYDEIDPYWRRHVKKAYLKAKKEENEMGIDKRTGYYSHREILGYGCKYNIVLSGRGPGKTWDAAWFFLNVKGPVMVLTRIKPDMMHLIDSFLDPYLEGDEDHDAIDGSRFKLKGSAEDGYVMYFDENPKFFFRTISQVNAIKQENFPKDMAWVWVEEFVPIAWKKIGGVVDEGEAIETIVKTIEHDTPENRRKKGLPEVRVIMHANPARWDNPILAYFGCVPFGYGIRRMSDKVVVEILEDRDTGENYVNKGIATNAQWKDMLHFIAPVAKTAVPWISVRVVEHYYLVYRRIDISYVKIIKGHTIDETQRWGTLDGLREDERCINGTRVYELLMRDAYKGRMRFVDINTKFQFLQDLRLMK